MPGYVYNSQRRSTVHALPILVVLFYVFFLRKCVLYHCHRVPTQLRLTNISISNFYAVRDTDISCLWEILVVANRTCVRGLSVVIVNGTYQPPYVEHLPLFMVCSGVLRRLEANYDAALSKRLPSRIWTNCARKWIWLPYGCFLSCLVWRWRMWRYERHHERTNFGKITPALWNASTFYFSVTGKAIEVWQKLIWFGGNLMISFLV